MSLIGKDWMKLRLPTHLDLPCSEDEVMPPWDFRVPDHTDLPDSDGEIVENTEELPQAILLTDCIQPILERRHPDGRFLVGGNSGIYWDLVDPPLRGAIGPDWFYVPNVPRLYVGGVRRRSYVMWKEREVPLIVMEFVSGDGSKERDRTPETGKFWIYENRVRADYYAIYDIDPGRVELYRLNTDASNRPVYLPVPPNERGRFPIPCLGVELGIWPGRFHTMYLPWLRWWDDRGILLPTSDERAVQNAILADVEARRADDEARRADDEARRADALAARLRALGIDPDDVAGSA